MHNENGQLPASESPPPEVLYQLGIKAFESRSLDQALNYLNEAIKADSRQFHYWFALALVLQGQNKYGEAAGCLRKTLELKPDFSQAYNHLGMLSQINGDLDDAITHFRQALKFSPGLAKVWNNLGSALNSLGKIDEAIAAFFEAVRLKPDYVLAYNNLGSAYQSQARVEEAENCYRKAIELQPDNIFAHYSLGHVLIVQWKMEEAEQILRRLPLLDPKNIQALNSLAYVLKEQGKYDEAASVYQRAISLKPNDLKAFIGAHLLLPPIYANTAELSLVRERFVDGLKTLRENIEKFRDNSLKYLLSGLRWTNFYLAYQGKDDKALQEEYAHFVADMLRVATPDLMRPLDKDAGASRRRLRIGFLSSFLRNCTVGSYFKTWITSLDRKKFEIYCYYTGHIQDNVTQELIDVSDCYRHLVGDEDYIGNQVKKDQLDILVYPEVGMDVGTFILAAMRLAPVQCAAWGHPVTTGHANIDYFFSSRLMEPENGRTHYSEQLILLNGIGTCYPKPILPSPAKRSDFSLPEEQVLYLCPQSLYKIHPDNDRLLVKILEQHKDAVLVFFQGDNDSVTRSFMKRLENVFDENGLEKNGRVKILPRMDRDSYLRVNMLCDAMLDTLYWSGGNTSLDALACGLPIVTLPGEFMRGRQSYGMLSAMGLPELIAGNQKEYLEIALHLGMDSVWRMRIRQRIFQNTSKVFDTVEPVRELEGFFLSQFSPATE